MMGGMSQLNAEKVGRRRSREKRNRRKSVRDEKGKYKRIREMERRLNGKGVVRMRDRTE